MAQTIQDELNTLIGNFAKNSIAQPGAADPFAPVLDDNGNVIEQAPAAAPAQPNVAPAPAAAPAAAQTPPVEPSTPVSPVDGLIEDWDSPAQGAPSQETPTTPAQTAPTTAVDPELLSIAKVLGKEEIKSTKEVVTVVEEMKKELESLKALPDDLAKAVEIAKSQGNYLEYLQVGAVDWSKEDPVVLYENYVEEQFYDPQTGLVDYERVDKFLERLDDDEKEFRGKELQRNYIAYQKQQKEAILAQARAQKEQFERSVKQAIEELKDVNGFVVSPAKKAELLDYVLSGADLKVSDVKTRVINAFLHKNFQSIDKYMKTKIQNAVKREILQEAQLPDVQPSTQPVETTPQKGYSLSDYLADLQKQRGF